MHKLDSLQYHIKPKGIDLTDKESIALGIGSLLYTPATNLKIASNINKLRTTSLVLDLEDSIGDEELAFAEQTLLTTLDSLLGKSNLPMCFIRVRNPKHLAHILSLLSSEHLNLITGFNLPKYDHETAKVYLDMLPYNKYAIPILETAAFVNPLTRTQTLATLKELERQYSSNILAYQVGSTDFSSILGVRRYYDQTIYDITSLSLVLGEIVNTFSPDNVIIGPVNEYYHFDETSGFMKELGLDLINGFTGKTAIHPNQVEPIIKNLAVHISNYKDAQDILNDLTGAGSSYNRNRMNEAKPHKKWAHRILKLADIYGVYK